MNKMRNSKLHNQGYMIAYVLGLYAMGLVFIMAGIQSSAIGNGRLAVVEFIIALLAIYLARRAIFLKVEMEKEVVDVYIVGGPFLWVSFVLYKNRWRWLLVTEREKGGLYLLQAKRKEEQTRK